MKITSKGETVYLADEKTGKSAADDNDVIDAMPGGRGEGGEGGVQADEIPFSKTDSAALMTADRNGDG